MRAPRHDDQAVKDMDGALRSGVRIAAAYRKCSGKRRLACLSGRWLWKMSVSGWRRNIVPRRRLAAVIAADYYGRARCPAASEPASGICSFPLPRYRPEHPIRIWMRRCKRPAHDVFNGVTKIWARCGRCARAAWHRGGRKRRRTGTDRRSPFRHRTLTRTGAWDRCGFQRIQGPRQGKLAKPKRLYDLDIESQSFEHDGSPEVHDVNGHGPEPWGILWQDHESNPCIFCDARWVSKLQYPAVLRSGKPQGWLRLSGAQRTPPLDPACLSLSNADSHRVSSHCLHCKPLYCKPRRWQRRTSPSCARGSKYRGATHALGGLGMHAVGSREVSRGGVGFRVGRQ